MHVPIHAQQTDSLTDERRALTKRAADLCRSQPAVFAAVVRRADELRAAGVEHDEALRQALEEAGAPSPALLPLRAGDDRQPGQAVLGASCARCSAVRPRA